jgi:cold shock CspA family protein
MGLRVSAIDYGDRYPLLAVPLYAQYAYPGVDYVNGVCEDIPSKVAPFVKEWKAFVPYHKSVKATWDPVGADLPETMKGKGWHLGLPEFFCGVTGYGRILCQDGEKCFVHFSRIIGPDGAPVGSRGKLPILEPMKYVAIKYQNGDKGRQATAVRIL